jgi:signal peptidase I
MDPTFHSGQFLIVDRLEYRFENPERGEVIVFRYPNNPKNYYIKRIIGIPGDEIDIRDGTINIKTEKGENISIDEPYVTKDRASHEDYHTVLTQGKYFVLGDNRMNSSDSRAWGNLDQKYIIGQPIIRLFPFNTISLSPGKYSYEKTK